MYVLFIMYPQNTILLAVNLVYMVANVLKTEHLSGFEKKNFI